MEQPRRLNQTAVWSGGGAPAANLLLAHQLMVVTRAPHTHAHTHPRTPRKAHTRAAREARADSAATRGTASAQPAQQHGIDAAVCILYRVGHDLGDLLHLLHELLTHTHHHSAEDQTSLLARLACVAAMAAAATSQQPAASNHKSSLGERGRLATDLAVVLKLGRGQLRQHAGAAHHRTTPATPPPQTTPPPTLSTPSPAACARCPQTTQGGGRCSGQHKPTGASPA